MKEVIKPRHVARFESFEVNLRSGELLKNGERIKLPEQSFQILTMLLERPHGAIQDSRRSSIVVVQPSTETFSALDRPCVYEVVWVRLNQAVAQALVVSLAVIMSYEVLNGCSQRTFPEQDQPLEAGLLDAADEALGVGVQIWISGWQFDGFDTDVLQHAQKRSVNSGSRSWIT